MIRRSAGKDRYWAGETDIVWGTFKTELGTQPRGVVFAHGSGDLAESASNTGRFLLNRLARRSTVHVGDLGGQTWGSDAVVDRIDAAIDYLVTERGVVEPVTLVGASMGGCSVLNHVVRHPERVSCVALLIPLTDLNNARANPWLTGRWPEMDALYPDGVSGDWDGHNPIDFVDDIDPDLPMKIWYSSDDGLVPPATVEAFVAARPQTEADLVGAYGHSVPLNGPLSEEIANWISLHR